MTDFPCVSNVLAVHDNAFPHHVEFGMTWYDIAHNEARALGGKRYMRAAGVIAALSPMNHWTNNIAKARMLYANDGNVIIAADGSNGYGLSKNVAKAVRIYRGEDAFDVLGGDKVRAFWQTIVDPRADTIPVIDRHAFDITIGEQTSEKRRGALSRKNYYAAFAGAYRIAAKARGISPSQIQAITWVAWREACGITD